MWPSRPVTGIALYFLTAPGGLLFPDVLLTALGTCDTEQALLHAEHMASERNSLEHSSCIVATKVDVALNGRESP
jgi:hypothetical protein